MKKSLFLSFIFISLSCVGQGRLYSFIESDHIITFDAEDGLLLPSISTSNYYTIGDIKLLDGYLDVSVYILNRSYQDIKISPSQIIVTGHYKGRLKTLKLENYSEYIRIIEEREKEGYYTEPHITAKQTRNSVFITSTLEAQDQYQGSVYIKYDPKWCQNISVKINIPEPHTYTWIKTR